MDEALEHLKHALKELDMAEHGLAPNREVWMAWNHAHSALRETIWVMEGLA